MIITTIQPGTRCMSTSEMNAAEISNLSAIGSSRIPSVVTCACRRAKYPSAQSVAAAVSKISTPQTSKCTGNPHNSTLGLRVNSTTMSTGTKKILSTVRKFGRFIVNYPRGFIPASWDPSATIVSASYCVNARKNAGIPAHFCTHL
jgi:hypothetical protein